MVSMTVADIEPGAQDPVFGPITAVFARKGGEYAIYRTTGRILIQYADDPRLEAAQRTAIAPLGPIRSEINALIDGWRTSRRAHIVNRVAGLDRRTGDGPGAVLELNKVRNAIIAERTASARFVYLIVALGVALVASLTVAALAYANPGLCTTWTGWDGVLTAILGGLAGSFFSIATGLSKRTVLPVALGSDNILDAVLRMLIGIISAGILICLLHGGLGMTFAFARLPDAPPVPTDPTLPIVWMQLVTLGFLAGFSERLVPDLLEKAGQAVQATKLPADEPIVSTPAPTPPDLKAARTN